MRDVFRLNSEKIMRRVGDLGAILGLTPKDMRRKDESGVVESEPMSVTTRQWTAAEVLAELHRNHVWLRSLGVRL